MFGVSFTADSISLTWYPQSCEVFVLGRSSTVLSYETRRQQPIDVPAPLTLSLFAAGLGGIAMARRRRA